MKKAKLTLAVTLATMLVLSCSKENVFVSQQDTFTIPKEEALANLRSLMSELDNDTKASAHEMAIAEFSVVSTNDLSIPTRSNGAIVTDSLLYIVNFENDEGFAVMAADRRIKSDILAVAERGHLSPSLLSLAANPGQFISDSTLAQTDSLFIPSLIVSYLNNSGPDDGDHDGTNPGDDGGNGGGGSSGWSTYATVSPMIHNLWNQEYPFNTRTPLDNNGYNKPAGCVPVALGTIITYWASPAYYSINGHVLDWNGMQQVYRFSNGHTNYTNEEETEDVAILLAHIGSRCDALYTSDWTFAWPSNARDYLEDIGYFNATLHTGYDETLITDMLSEGKPVFIAGVSGIASGHAWVIDGMLRQRRDGSTRVLMHCKYGLGAGHCDGYYVSDMFDTTQGPVSYDPASEDGITMGDKNYNHFFRIITY